MIVKYTDIAMMPVKNNYTVQRLRESPLASDDICSICGAPLTSGDRCICEDCEEHPLKFMNAKPAVI